MSQPSDTQVDRAVERASAMALSDNNFIMSSDDVSVGFGQTTIMQDITVGFHKGSINALIGPSGSGKTTFLRSLNRMNDKVRDFWHRGGLYLSR